MTAPWPVLKPPVGPMTAARAYLRAELDARGNALPVGVMPSSGDRHQPSSGVIPQSYALLTRPGSSRRSAFSTDYLIRVVVFDDDSERLEANADLVYALLMGAGHRKVTTSRGDVWISDAIHQMGPSEHDDPEVPLFGLELAVFWTIGLKPA